MKKGEIIGIIIFFILAIVWVATVWPKQSDSQKADINCQTSCFKVGSRGWSFPGAGIILKNTFSTKEQCIFVCQNKFKK